MESEIGRGRTGVVYRAKDLRLDRTLVVKLLAPELGRNETFRRRFVHDIRIAAAIDHPHIVPIFEVGEADGLLYIAMRYIAALNLREILDQYGALSVTGAIRIAGQVASALDSAHAHGVVHGDVSPGNILVARSADEDRPQYAYLTDFGIDIRTLTENFTCTGPFAGTLDYVAPEQISGQPVNRATDLYALACVVYEAIAGDPVFPREEDTALMRAHKRNEPPPLSQRLPGITAHVDDVMRTALAKAPDDRYGSCLEFTEELRAAVGGPEVLPT
ncbi:serine/threonine-protein kinase [Streptomyces spiramyceticus]|uniref:serine/threonine-protein kinase n=1 Tax=Streptomyces spiramyceticus TaxID=299717 RepID=UPI00237B5D8E|nr:serine/threonine-protein kinase [Streptomyces spiramyceticus]